MDEQFVSLAAEGPATAALIEADGRVTTRTELLARARALSTELANAGFAAGEMLAVQLPNSVDFVATWLASLERKLIFVPIDRDAPETEVGSILTHFGIRGLVYRPDRASPAIEITTRPSAPHPPLPR